MSVNRVFEEVTETIDDEEKGTLLSFITGGKAYILLTVDEVNSETGALSVRMDDNSPDLGDDTYLAIRFILENVLDILPNPAKEV